MAFPLYYKTKTGTLEWVGSCTKHATLMISIAKNSLFRKENFICKCWMCHHEGIEPRHAIEEFKTWVSLRLS